MVGLSVFMQPYFYFFALNLSCSGLNHVGFALLSVKSRNRLAHDVIYS